MRRIIFNEETIDAIRAYINEGHTQDETCNRFNIKYDTLKRVMHENNILPYRKDKSHPTRVISLEKAELVANLFQFTNTSMKDIVKESKLEYYQVIEILNSRFSKAEIDKRKSKLYSDSKLGDKNPMKQLTGEQHPRYKGIVSDGRGYYMVKKPEWYTGRCKDFYVFYHTVVMCEHLGITEIPKGFVIHHIDGDKHNNDISNLALVTSSAHSKIHQLQRKLASKVQRLSEQE